MNAVDDRVRGVDVDEIAPTNGGRVVADPDEDRGAVGRRTNDIGETGDELELSKPVLTEASAPFGRVRAAPGGRVLGVGGCTHMARL
ncbi:MAG: hypothetical protein HY682_08745 [Chloroflexi bacterium]|nr:hypothetical protein [Chloroflexota bacterium]